MLKRIRNRFKKIKWWFQRANHKVPPCDWWDFKYSLADYIAQGLKGLLYEGCRDWDNPLHKQEKKDLEFILKWAESFPSMASGFVARDKEDYEHLVERYKDSDKMIISAEVWGQWEKDQTKALKLLDKYFLGLWD